jgi:membrane protease YdiL (CAAX protease family)
VTRRAGWARRVAQLVPGVVPVGMAATFAVAGRRLGPRRGYLAAFAVYWAVCLGLPLAALGPRRCADLVRRPAQPLPRPRAIALAMLGIPLAGAIAVELIPNLRAAGPKLVATSLGIAAVNATAEELLWRGLPITAFPDSAWRGWLLPATGFTLWHLAPLAAMRRWSRAPGVLAGAALIGFGYGWVAWRTRSLRWTIPPHLLTDASGIRSVRRAWLGDAGA